MRQINVEKDDPLKRIQEEINEVARRERELRQKDDDPTAHLENMSGISDDSGISSASSPVNGMSSNVNSNSVMSGAASTTPMSPQQQHNTMTNGKSNGDAVVTAAAVPPVPFKRSITVASSSPMQQQTTPLAHSPASHHMTMVGPKLTRAVSTPQIFTPAAKRFSMAGSQKGMMQRFLATRGKYTPGGSTTGGRGGLDSILTSIELNRSPINITPEFSPPIIERDENGRPIRRGYVPVEEKIQRELRDLKSRETELKRHQRMCKLRQSQPDLLDAVNGSLQFDSGEESTGEDEVDGDDLTEHCYSPGKLRASKSIGELCHALNAETISSPRHSPCPPRSASSNNQRPAVSLAALCDVEPEAAPSSLRLIAQWENMIQQRQEVA